MSAAEVPAIRQRVSRTRVTAVDAGVSTSKRDHLVAEEPLEIRACGPGQEPVSVAVTMRTPGADMELAAGFLFTEGLLAGGHEIHSMRYCGTEVPPEERFNVVTVQLRRAFDAGSLQRNFFATSSCGICGKASLDQVERDCAPVADGPVVQADVVSALPGLLRSSQELFDETGGLHAAGLFSADGSLLEAREDIGRHNALDKLIGGQLLAGRLPGDRQVLFLSGRIGFELVQKAAVAGFPIVCAVSAPSTLAVDLASRVGMTVIGFVRDDRFNIYTRPERIAVPARPAAR